MFFTAIPSIWRGKYFSSGNEPAENNPVTPMLRHLMYKIKSTGPITVAEYMKEVLTNPAKVWSGSPRTRPSVADLRGASQEGEARRSSAQAVGVPARGRAISEDLGTDNLSVGQGWLTSEAGPINRRGHGPRVFRRQNVADWIYDAGRMTFLLG